MTDAQKVEALTEIMGDVLCTLELKQYDIEDPQLSHDCVVDADKFRQRMMDILHSNWTDHEDQNINTQITKQSENSCSYLCH